MIRKGMWCIDQDGAIGIASKDVLFGPDGREQRTADGNRVIVETFHHVAEDGSTARIEYRGWAGLKQARRDQIPEARRPDGDTAVRLGYA